MDKLYKIIGITEQNKIVFYCDLDDNKNKQNEIIALERLQKILQLWPLGYFERGQELDRPYLSLLRSILKAMKLKQPLLLLLVLIKETKQDLQLCKKMRLDLKNKIYSSFIKY